MNITAPNTISNVIENVSAPLIKIKLNKSVHIPIKDMILTNQNLYLSCKFPSDFILPSDLSSENY